MFLWCHMEIVRLRNSCFIASTLPFQTLFTSPRGLSTFCFALSFKNKQIRCTDCFSICISNLRGCEWQGNTIKTNRLCLYYETEEDQQQFLALRYTNTAGFSSRLLWPALSYTDLSQKRLAKRTSNNLLWFSMVPTYSTNKMHIIMTPLTKKPTYYLFLTYPRYHVA